MEKGTYKGFYQYDNENINKSRGYTKTNFIIEITESNERSFKGWVEDDITTGGMEGRGAISGVVDGNKIYFVKQMPYLGLQFNDDKTGEYQLKIDKTKRHMPIYYNGKVGGTIYYNGKWNFRYYNHLINLKIMIKRIKTGGTWEMTKVNY